jgi:hypothetical protein
MSFGKPGGELMKVDTFKRETQRAELAEIIRGCCLQHSSKIAETILENYFLLKITNGA